jgi:anti-sigma-K factor RskA
MTDTRHDDFEVMAAAYAIDALDVDERKPFEAHLSECAACRELVAEYRRVTAGIGLGTEAVDPPASLRQRTIARATGKRAVTAPAPVPAARPSMAWLAVAAALVLAVGAGLYGVYQRAVALTYREALAQRTPQERQLRTDLAQARGEVRQLSSALDVLSAPDVMRIELAAASTGVTASGRAFWSRSTGFLLRTDRLPALEPGRAYQLWVVLPNAAPRGAGVFTVSRDGSGTMVAPAPSELTVPPDIVLTLAITNEPAAGSPGPTTPILLAGNAKTE